MSRLSLCTLLVLLTAPVQRCLSWEVYIARTDLESYFMGTSLFDLIQGNQVVIVADRSSRVSVNGSLLLTSADGAMQGLLPPLSRDVDHVTITWAANSSEVEYILNTVSVDPEGFFASPNISSISTTGAVPSHTSTFSLDLSCGAGARGEGSVTFDLYLMDNSTTVQEAFVITKDCGDILPYTPAPSLTPSLTGGAPSLTPSLTGGAPGLTPSLTGGAPSLSPSLTDGVPNLTPSLTDGVPNLTPSLTGGVPSPTPSLTVGVPYLTPSLTGGPPALTPSLTDGLRPSLTGAVMPTVAVQLSSVVLPVTTQTFTAGVSSSLDVGSGFSPSLLSTVLTPPLTVTPSPTPSASNKLFTSDLASDTSMTTQPQSTTYDQGPESSTFMLFVPVSSSVTTGKQSTTMSLMASQQFTRTPSSASQPVATPSSVGTVLQESSSLTLSSGSLVLTPSLSASPNSRLLPSPTSTPSLVPLSSAVTVESSSSSTVSPVLVSPSSMSPSPIATTATPMSPSPIASTATPMSPSPIASTATPMSPSLIATTATPMSPSPIASTTTPMSPSPIATTATPMSPSPIATTATPLSPSPIATTATPMRLLSSSTTVTSSSLSDSVNPTSPSVTIQPSQPPSSVPPSAPQPPSSVPPSASQPPSSVPPSAPQPFSSVPPSASQPTSSMPPSASVSPSASQPPSSAPPLASQPPSSAPPLASQPPSSVPPSASQPTSSMPPSAFVPPLASQLSSSMPPSASVPPSASQLSSSMPPSASVPPSASQLSSSMPPSASVSPSASQPPSSAPPSASQPTSSMPPSASVPPSASQPSSSMPPSASVPPSASQPPLSASPSASPQVPLNGTRIPAKEPELTLLLAIVFAPVVSVLVVCILLTVCFIACICRKKRRATKQFSDDPGDLPVPIYSTEAPGGGEFEESGKKTEAPISLWMSLPWGEVSTLPQAVLTVIEAHTVDRRALNILSTICRGEYGCIVNGQLSVDRTDIVNGHKGVMMKMLIGFTQTNGHHNEIAKFLEQATLLRGLDHPNIAGVLRVSVEDNLVPLVLYPIVEYGNLHTFLAFCRVSPAESPLNPSPEYRGYVRSSGNLPVTLLYKVNFGLQIAYAMRYLSESGLVHPDLALRNCLLDTSYLVKVSDSALSQEFFPKCYYTIKGSVRPVRWAALETLQEGLCTSQSNVWSFAVTLWEVLTLAEFPYEEVDNNRSIPSHLMMGARLNQPQDCPDHLYQLMQACWEKNAESRPNFTCVHSRLEEFNEQLTLLQNDSPSSVDSLRPNPDPYSRENSHDQLNSEYSSLQSRRRRSGRSSYSKNSPGIRRKSVQSRVSGAGSEHLSLTFSVLSDDLSSGSSSGNEEGPEGLSPLPESVVYQMLPSLLKEDKLENSEDVKHLPTSSPMNLVSSYLETSDNKNSIELEDSSKYIPLQSTFISPAPATPSTITTRLTPCETTSYTSSQGPSTVRSDESAPLPPSPSPDLTSKSSTFGEDMSSNPRSSFISHSNADTVSKASVSDSVGVATPGPDSHPSFSVNSDPYSQTNGHGDMSGEQPLMNGGHPPERTDEVGDSNGVVNGYSREESLKSDTNRASFNLGLGDLSSDLMATFDSWDI